MGMSSIRLWTVATTLPWLIMAPLGRPVVPEVYMRTATSSGSTSTEGPRGSLAGAVTPAVVPAPASAGRLPVTRCRADSSATTTVAPASSMMNCSSAGLSRVLSGTNTAPRCSVATRCSTSSALLAPA